jgi:hypothetical protein
LYSPLRFAEAQVVPAAARVRIEIEEWRRLLLQVLDQHDEHHVLQHVGEVPGMERVAIVHDRLDPRSAVT